MKVLMVCTGNICRSPMAEGILNHLIKQRGLTEWLIDSAGTHNYHIGETPDIRAISTLHSYGIDISTQRARKINISDINFFDLILVATDAHLHFINTFCQSIDKNHIKIEKMLATHPSLSNEDLQDPYYGENEDFIITYKTLYTALNSRLERL